MAGIIPFSVGGNESIPPQYLEVTDEHSGGHKPPLLAILGTVVVVVLIIAGLVFIFGKPIRDYKAVPYPPVTYIAREGRPVPTIPTGDIFSKKKMERYLDGIGFSIRLIKEDADGRIRAERNIVLSTLEYLDQENQPLRKAVIADVKKSLEDGQTWLKSREPELRRYLFAIDETGGVDTNLQDQVLLNFSNLELRQKIAGSDGLDFNLILLSSGEFGNQIVHHTIPLHAKPDQVVADFEKIDKVFKVALTPRGEQQTSSLWLGLIRAIVNAGPEYLTVKMFSDALENDDSTTSFEFQPWGDPKVLGDKAKWGDLDKLFRDPVTQEYGDHLPNLSSVIVEWYPTPRPGKEDTIRAALAYWQHLGKLYGMTINVH